MKQIEFEGATHQFPDDFTDADIAKALGAPKSAPTSAAPAAPQPKFVADAAKSGDPFLGFLANLNKVGNAWTPSAATAATTVIPGAGLAPAAARTAVSGVGHGLESGSAQNGLQNALIQAITEGAAPIAAPIVRGVGNAAGAVADHLPLLGSLRAIRRGANALTAQAQAANAPAVHQAANFAPPSPVIYGPTGAPVAGGVTSPITFNRVVPGAPGASVIGGGGAGVTPTTVTVAPPAGGTPITSGQSPAAILQEHMGQIPGPTRDYAGALMRLLGMGAQSDTVQGNK